MMQKATPVGGYEYKFVNQLPDRLMCKICHYPSKEPYLSGCCGHTFCKSCLDIAKKSAIVSSACPVCRNEDFTTTHNKEAERSIRSQHIFCTNEEKGCKWQGEVNNINNHLHDRNAGCQYEEVECSNNCGKYIQRKDLSSHTRKECELREVDCQYCHITGMHKFINGEHKGLCPEFSIPCPNKCKAGTIPKDSVEEHKKVCPLEQIWCDYRVVGCDKRMAREDQEKHNKETMEEHLSLAKHSLDEEKDKVKKTKEELDATKEELSSFKKWVWRGGITVAVVFCTIGLGWYCYRAQSNSDAIEEKMAKCNSKIVEYEIFFSKIKDLHNAMQHAFIVFDQDK